jgi:hypothetical protein
LIHAPAIAVTFLVPQFAAAMTSYQGGTHRWDPKRYGTGLFLSLLMPQVGKVAVYLYHALALEAAFF